MQNPRLTGGPVAQPESCKNLVSFFLISSLSTLTNDGWFEMVPDDCDWRVIATWIDTEGGIRIAGMGRTPELRIWQKTDEIEALKKLCDLLKQLGVSKCAAKSRPDQPQTSEITITNGRDVAFILDNIVRYQIVKTRIRQAKSVREFLHQRRNRPV